MAIYGVRKNESYITAGKTIRQLIEELQMFDNQDIEVRISLDCRRQTHKPISTVGIL